MTANKAISEILSVVNEQAEDEGLWSVPLIEGTQSIAEAYLQMELRRLHEVIESCAKKIKRKKCRCGEPIPKECHECFERFMDGAGVKI